LHGGEWSAQDHVLRQKSQAENIRAFAGNKTWSNYTYSLKARHGGGDEGFLIPFLVQDENAKGWWNIGGWGNVRHALEMNGIIGNEVPGHIETGRWYDIRIELTDTRIKCFLDDKLIHDVTYPVTKALYAVASRAKGGHEVILKVVNVGPTSQDTDLKLNGAKVGPTANVTVLTSDKPEDENSLDQPAHIAPVTSTLAWNGPTLRHIFPGNSVTILLVKVQ